MILGGEKFILNELKGFVVGKELNTLTSDIIGFENVGIKDIQLKSGTIKLLKLLQEQLCIGVQKCMPKLNPFNNPFQKLLIMIFPRYPYIYKVDIIGKIAF